MKKLLTLLTILILLGCDAPKENYFNKYRFVLKTTHDNNWTTSASIHCDSFQMKSKTLVDFWVDGKKMNMEAPQFRIYDNKKYKP